MTWEVRKDFLFSKFLNSIGKLVVQTVQSVKNVLCRVLLRGKVFKCNKQFSLFYHLTDSEYVRQINYSLCRLFGVEKLQKGLVVVEKEPSKAEFSSIEKTLKDHSNWLYMIHSLQMEYRLVPVSHLGITPYEIMHGRQFQHPCGGLEKTHEGDAQEKLDLSPGNHGRQQELLRAWTKKLNVETSGLENKPGKVVERKRRSVGSLVHGVAIRVADIKVGALVTTVARFNNRTNSFVGPYRIVEVLRHKRVDCVRVKHIRTGRLVHNLIPFNQLLPYKSMGRTKPKYRVLHVSCDGFLKLLDTKTGICKDVPSDSIEVYVSQFDKDVWLPEYTILKVDFHGISVENTSSSEVSTVGHEQVLVQVQDAYENTTDSPER